MNQVTQSDVISSYASASGTGAMEKTDEKKSKVGYEIPFTRYFYKYEAPQPSTEIMAEILELE